MFGHAERNGVFGTRRLWNRHIYTFRRQSTFRGFDLHHPKRVWFCGGNVRGFRWKLRGRLIADKTRSIQAHLLVHFFDLPQTSSRNVEIKPRYFDSRSCIDIIFTYLGLSSQISVITWVVIVVHRSADLIFRLSARQANSEEPRPIHSGYGPLVEWSFRHVSLYSKKLSLQELQTPFHQQMHAPNAAIHYVCFLTPLICPDVTSIVHSSYLQCHRALLFKAVRLIIFKNPSVHIVTQDMVLIKTDWHIHCHRPAFPYLPMILMYAFRHISYLTIFDCSF